MKLSNEIKSLLSVENFDLEHESKMVQSRIISTFLEVIDEKDLTQCDLEKKTGLKQSFISALMNQNRKLNMNHIALLQNALGIILQPPTYLIKEEHNEKFYSELDYEPVSNFFPDSNELKDENITSWMKPFIKENAIESESYNTIKSKCFELNTENNFTKTKEKLEFY